MLIHGIHQALNEESVTQMHRLGDRVEFANGSETAAFVYVQFDVAATLITDIFRYDTYINKLVDQTTDASNMIAGLLCLSAVNTTQYFGWLQYWGAKLTQLDGTTALSNNLLGDGSVASGEALMPHASTNGMVDTFAGAVNIDMGVALEDDAPAITLYCLMCRASAV